MRRQPIVLGEHRLDLRGKYVHAADDQHIVAAALDPLDPPHGARRSRQQSGEIARAIADDRHAFLGQSGEDQLAALSICERVANWGSTISG